MNLDDVIVGNDESSGLAETDVVIEASPLVAAPMEFVPPAGFFPSEDPLSSPDAKVVHMTVVRPVSSRHRSTQNYCPLLTQKFSLTILSRTTIHSTVVRWG